MPEEEESRFVGVWGQRHLQYLKEYRRTVYLDLMMSGRAREIVNKEIIYQ